jgi:hypothetical protein
VLDAGSFDSLASPRGLLGLYFRGGEWNGTPFLEEWDPVLNFTNGNDFSTAPVCPVLWTGKLEVEDPGNYRFLFTPPSSARLKIDGKEWNGENPGNTGVFLKKGSHSLDLYAGHAGYWPSFSFMWVKPNGKVEVVPYSAFGEVR